MYFQNPFVADFHAPLLLGDRHYSLPFKVPGNKGRSDAIIWTWNEGPYDLSGNDADSNSEDTLQIQFSILGPEEFRHWASLSVNIASGAVSAAAVTAHEIKTALDADATFAAYFEAEVRDNTRLAISQRMEVTKFRYYVVNGRAESVLGFNLKSGISEIPSFFERHTIANRFTFEDSQNMLIALDPSGSDVDAAVIDNALDFRGQSRGLDSGTVREDWELLEGKSGLFIFKKITVDGSNRITQIIEYQAGAGVGDFAKKTEYSYTAANTNPDSITEIPYVLQSGDLLTP